MVPGRRKDLAVQSDSLGVSIRRFIRGEVSRQQLEAIAEEVSARYGESMHSLELLDADNWLSTPCVVNDEWFVKVISAQNTFVHGLLTTGRNLGVFSSGSEGFFEHFGTPIGMAEHELASTRRMREFGVKAPEPLEAFEYDGFGVLVFEYLPNFHSLDELDTASVEAVLPDLFDSLSRLHDHGLVHGDLRGENVLVVDGDLYFIDATKVREDAIDDARAYDIACALGALEPLVGARATVAPAAEYYGNETLLAADSYLDFVNIRPDHDFDAAALKGEISKYVE